MSFSPVQISYMEINYNDRPDEWGKYAHAYLHLGFLNGLSRGKGYCDQTDKELARIFNVCIGDIERWNNVLLQRNNIKIRNEEVHFIGSDKQIKWETIRKIFVQGVGTR